MGTSTNSCYQVFLYLFSSFNRKNYGFKYPKKLKAVFNCPIVLSSNADLGDEEIEVDWSKVDIESSTIRFVFKNQIDSPGPITLQSNNWKNI